MSSAKIINQMQKNADEKLKSLGLEKFGNEYKLNSIIMISPETASKLLESNTNNRRVSHSKVQQYAIAMKANKWQLNGETIKFNQAGELIDGQHRLNAVISAGVSVPIEVCFDTPKEAFKTIDTGKSRNAADIISIHENTNAATISAALKALIYYERGLPIGSKGSSLTDVNCSTNKKYSLITNDDIENAYGKYVQLSHFIPTNKQIRTLGNKALLTAMHFLFNTADPEHATYFMTQLYTGEFLSLDNARKRVELIGELEKKITVMYAHRSHTPMSTKLIATLMITTWNKWIIEKKIKGKLTIRSNDEQPLIYKPDGTILELK